MKGYITLKFSTELTLEVDIPSTDGIETVTAEELEEIAYNCRTNDEDIFRAYDTADETLVTEFTCGDFTKKFNEGE